jgi:hypothetical protein
MKLEGVDGKSLTANNDNLFCRDLSHAFPKQAHRPASKLLLLPFDHLTESRRQKRRRAMAI